MKLELKVNSDEYFMSMILLVFGICCVLLLCFRLPFTQLYDHEKAKQLAPNLPPQVLQSTTKYFNNNNKKILSDTLQVILFQRNLCSFYCISLYNSFLLSFSVTDFLYRNLPLNPFLMVLIDLIPWPFQCFDKYDRDYSTDDKTR